MKNQIRIDHPRDYSFEVHFTLTTTPSTPNTMGSKL
jgi:hypothetical protein